MRRGKRRTFALTNFDNEQTLTRRFLGVEEERDIGSNRLAIGDCENVKEILVE